MDMWYGNAETLAKRKEENVDGYEKKSITEKEDTGKYFP